ncbi:MAG TPA: glycosyltransferase family 4 protein [Roseateles sp.]|nr:glycosyltransferase family 4 protein [Roseateles sp.]
MSRPHVLHLTTVHPRDDIRIFHKECRSLAAAGYRVTLLVGDGLGDAEVDGVRIVDLGPRPAGRLQRMREQPRRALARVRELRPTLVHFHDPELLPVGVQLQREGMLAVYDAHEDVPRQILTKQWIPAPLRPALSRVFEFYENRQVRRLRAVVAATPHIRDRFAALGVTALTVANYPHPTELAVPSEGVSREPALCYVGGITRTRGALQMVQLLERLPGVRLLLCGSMEDAALEQQLRALPGWRQVDYLGRVDRAGVREVMARSRLGLVTLLPLPSYQDALPIKMFEYMSAELPVLASDFPLWRDIVERAGCGVCVDPTDVECMARAASALLADPARCAQLGRQGRAAVDREFNWPRQEQALLAGYEQLLGNDR